MNEITLFTYAGLPIDVANEARVAAERIKLRLRRTAEDIIEIGRDLASVKVRIGHGNFLPWLEAEFGMSDKTAQKMMQVAKVYGGKSELSSNLPLSALYELAAPSTPPEVRATAEHQADNGDLVSVADVRRWKQEAEAASARADDADLASTRYRAQAETLLDNQKTLIADAEERVREAARQEIDAAKSEAEKIRSALTAENEKLQKLSEQVREAAIAEARGKAEALAEEEMSKRKTALSKAEGDLAKIKADIDRRNLALASIESRIAEQKTFADRLGTVEYESTQILKEADELIRLQALLMVTLSDIERAIDHPDKVRRTVQTLANQCGRLHEVLTSFYDEHPTEHLGGILK